jgi:hypothetical protein
MSEHHLLQQQAAAAGLYGMNLQKMMSLPQLAGLKRPISSITPDMSQIGFPPVKRLNLLETAAAAHQQAAQQAAAMQQRAHFLAQTANLPRLSSTASPCPPGMKPHGTSSADNDPGRMPHRLIEKKRRDRINSCINQLRELLPESIKKATNRPLEKAIVLELSIDYIKQLQKEGKNDDEDKQKDKKSTTLPKQTLAATYEKGWYDCSTSLNQLLKTGQTITEFPLHPPKDRFINMNSEKVLQQTTTTTTTNQNKNRVPSTGSEGYDSDEFRKNSMTSEDPALSKPIVVSAPLPPPPQQVQQQQQQSKPVEQNSCTQGSCGGSASGNTESSDENSEIDVC